MLPVLFIIAVICTFLFLLLVELCISRAISHVAKTWNISVDNMNENMQDVVKDAVATEVQLYRRKERKRRSETKVLISKHLMDRIDALFSVAHIKAVFKENPTSAEAELKRKFTNSTKVITQIFVNDYMNGRLSQQSELFLKRLAKKVYNAQYKISPYKSYTNYLSLAACVYYLTEMFVLEIGDYDVDLKFDEVTKMFSYSFCDKEDWVLFRNSVNQFKNASSAINVFKTMNIPESGDNTWNNTGDTDDEHATNPVSTPDADNNNEHDADQVSGNDVNHDNEHDTDQATSENSSWTVADFVKFCVSHNVTPRYFQYYLRLLDMNNYAFSSKLKHFDLPYVTDGRRAFVTPDNATGGVPPADEEDTTYTLRLYQVCSVLHSSGRFGKSEYLKGYYFVSNSDYTKYYVVQIGQNGVESFETNMQLGEDNKFVASHTYDEFVFGFTKPIRCTSDWVVDMSSPV